MNWLQQGKQKVIRTNLTSLEQDQIIEKLVGFITKISGCIVDLRVEANEITQAVNDHTKVLEGITKQLDEIKETYGRRLDMHYDKFELLGKRVKHLEEMIEDPSSFLFKP